MKIAIISAALFFSVPLTSYSQVSNVPDSASKTIWTKQSLANPSERAAAQESQSVYRPGSMMAELLYKHSQGQPLDAKTPTAQESKDASH